MRIFAGNEESVVPIVLEFGTYNTVDINLPIMMDDHRLSRYGGVDSEQGKQIKSVAGPLA